MNKYVKENGRHLVIMKKNANNLLHLINSFGIAVNIDEVDVSNMLKINKILIQKIKKV